jgi:hypothetical protein
MTELFSARVASAAIVGCVLSILAVNSWLEAFEVGPENLSPVVSAGSLVMIWCAAGSPLRAEARSLVGQARHDC